MAEEVNYASVVFKSKGPRPEVKEREETEYGEVKIHSDTTEKHEEANAKSNDEIVYDEVRIISKPTTERPHINAKKNEEVVYDEVKFNSETTEDYPETKTEMNEEVVFGEVKYSETTEEYPETNVKKKECIVYEEVKSNSEISEKHRDSNAGLLADKEAEKSHFQKWRCCFGFICVILSLGIGGVCIYFTFIHQEVSQLKSNLTALREDNSNLSSHITNLISEKENLTRSLKDLTEQLDEFKNLTKSRSLLRDELKNLTSENLNLTSQKHNLEAENQKLEAERENLTKLILNLEATRENLTQQIFNLETELINFNTSLSQWSINAYCRQGNSRTCEPCEIGWKHNKSSCYAVNDHEPNNRKGWEGARKDCRGKGSDLTVVTDDAEKKNITVYFNWGSSGTNGYWIGLRADGGKWKWVDGTDLADSSWMTDPPNDGRCVISVKDEGWKSESCDSKQRWICEKAALSV